MKWQLGDAVVSVVVFLEQQEEGPEFESNGGRGLSVWSLYVCLGSFQVLWLFLTVQRNAVSGVRLTGNSKLPVSVNVGSNVCLFVSLR